MYEYGTQADKDAYMAKLAKAGKAPPVQQVKNSPTVGALGASTNEVGVHGKSIMDFTGANLHFHGVQDINGLHTQLSKIQQRAGAGGVKPK